VEVKNRFLLAVLACALFGGSGCALTSKAAVVETRYFSPESGTARSTAPDTSSPSPSAPPPAEDIAVRLGRVYSGQNLRERIVYRDHPYERGYYEDKRWTEWPEAYVRRALGRALYESHRFKRAVDGTAPTIEVEVIAFDDLLWHSSRAARVELQWIVFEGSEVLYEDTVTVDSPVAVAQPQIENVVAAMSDALDRAVERVATRVGEVVRQRTAPTASATP
jgi:cholesterol transport system auxiliary component